jgi:hypothetical protein
MYSKIFRRIYESSIAENPTLRFTFMDLLVLADKDGIVDITHEAIARITNRPLQEIRETISLLEGPDPKSRSPEDEGIRIRRLDQHRDWGWVIVNYDRFHDMAVEEDRRVSTRERVRRHRSKSRNDSNTEEKPQCNANVTPCNEMYKNVTDSSVSVSVSESVQKGGMGERGMSKNGTRFDKPTLEQVRLQCEKIGLPVAEAESFLAYYESNGWRVGKNPMRSWTAAMINWRKNWQERRNQSQCSRPGYPAMSARQVMSKDTPEQIKKFYDRLTST